MPDTYPHLPHPREQPINPRRTRPAPLRRPPPDDPRGFGVGLLRSLETAWGAQLPVGFLSGPFRSRETKTAFACSLALGA